MTVEPNPDERPYPDIRDPRVMVAVPRERRGAMAALWGLAERLTRVLMPARASR
ncbi:hypothetical protein [Sphingopyxis sp. PET50]|uniref:hypothetical protein n=1 Tax=Sphingopyxis sp. PET50 TaxID=2976533 RepID=UPI0021B023A9|nr:hypothetical protein [Sphingopyxis sp. PET50]